MWALEHNLPLLHTVQYFLHLQSACVISDQVDTLGYTGYIVHVTDKKIYVFIIESE